MSNRQIDDFDDVNEGEKGMENICYLIEGWKFQKWGSEMTQKIEHHVPKYLCMFPIR